MMSEFKDSQYAEMANEPDKTALCRTGLSAGRAIIGGAAMIAHTISDLSEAVREMADRQ